MTHLSFGVYVHPRGPDHGRDLLLRMEDTEFDTAWVEDTLGDCRNRSAPLLDSWVSLGAMAADTEDIELGILISNLTWRDPVQVARFAMSVDQISNGRFVLGLGCGQLEDQHMAGPDAFTMSPKERVDRLEEGVHVIDRLLRGDTSPFSGEFTTYNSVAMQPGCVQDPRLPLLVAGNGRRTMRVAAEHADTWNTWIDNGDVDLFHTQTVERIARLDSDLDELDRDPTTLTRSLLVYLDAMDPWSDAGAIPQLVDKFRPLGFTEFIFYPPRPDQYRAFLRIGVSVLPTLRD